MTSLTCRSVLVRRLSLSPVTAGKHLKKTKNQTSLSSRDRALEHFDDFYGTAFGKRRWPSLRLGLLSPAKYIAVVNPFGGNAGEVGSRLESIGAFDLRRIWREVKVGSTHDLAKDLNRISAMENTLRGIAQTKQAEEIDVLYSNSDERERAVGKNRRSHQEVAFMPPTRLKGVDDFAFDSDYYASFLPNQTDLKDDEIPVTYTKESTLKFTPLLQPYSFEAGSSTEFPAANRDPVTGLREYLCVNGASILPLLALDLNPSVDLLDLCAGPGTKSLMAMMTMCIKSLTCNDLDQYRLYRVKKIFHEFIGTENPPLTQFTRLNACDYPSIPKFNRVLADVPCLNDRTACNIPENNIFKTTRTKERLNLVKIQKNILLSALKVMSDEKNSATVYSTCTLSPVENDGVVMQALKETEVTGLGVDLVGLMNLVRPLEGMFFKVTRTRLGIVIEPGIWNNFGPMFVSRIVRV